MIKLIVNANIVLDNKIIRGEIKIAGDEIVEIGERLKRNDQIEIIDAANRYVIPGFIDIHSNGAAGFDLSSGVYDPGKNKFVKSSAKYRKGLERALRFYLKTGTTKVLLSSVSAPFGQTLDNFSMAASYKIEKSELSEILYGLYVEGLFIKDSNSRGAQNPKYFLKPAPSLIDQLRKSSGDLLKIINIPPEWGVGALRQIKNLNDKGIICSIGHSAATAKQFYNAASNGAVLATHFLNGPSSASFKPFEGGGVIEAVLKSPEIYAEIIPDGYHVDKSYILDVIKRKGLDKVIAITDNMFVTGMKGADEFNYMGVTGKFSPNKKYIYVKERPSALFGSVLTMDKAFSNLLNWLTGGLPGVWNSNHASLKFEEAILATVKLCSHNAADLLEKYSPSIKFGRIREGNKADILIIEITDNKTGYKVNIKNTFLNGKMA